jgi:hypothetical protein
MIGLQCKPIECAAQLWVAAQECLDCSERASKTAVVIGEHSA